MTNNKELHFLLIDNYDSFSYNLVELLRPYSFLELTILKNDDSSIFTDEYDAIIISPGPGLPSTSSFLLEALDYYVGRIPILGICLGLQAIVEHFGGKLKQLDRVFHGIKDQINILGKSPKKSKAESLLFLNVPKSITVGRYHSWVADNSTFPSSLTITAEDKEKNIMAVESQELYCYAVQFHPESYMTKLGSVLIENFINVSIEFSEKYNGKHLNSINSFH